MLASIVIGVQWGDEGKIVDHLAEVVGVV